jgi:hypothetical protein
LKSAEVLRQRYARLADDDLLELALQGAESLTPEALEFLRSELRNRGLGQHIQEAMDAQIGDFTPDEHAALVERFRSLPCPLCGSSDVALNAFRVMVVRSYILATTYERSLVIGCPQCIQKAAAAAKRTTLRRGWWSLLGVFRTAMALDMNNRALRAGERLDATPELLEYVRLHRGEVTALVGGEVRTE